MLAATDPLHDLKLRFLDRCREHVSILNGMLENPDQIKHGFQLGSIVKIVHSIAGTGGIFGFDEMSARAHKLETVLIAKEPADQPAMQGLLKLLCREIMDVLASHDGEAGRNERIVKSSANSIHRVVG